MTVSGSDSKSWSPNSCFPSPEEDLLKFLCLMGTKSFFPFRVSVNLETNSSFRKVAQEVEQSSRSRELTLNYDNSAQIKNDSSCSP